MNPQTPRNSPLTQILWTVVLLLPFAIGNSASAIAQRSVPLDVLFVLDQSRSMRQNDPKRTVTQAVSQFIQQLPSEDNVGLVLFGSQAWSVQALGPLDAEHRRQLLASIADIRYADAQSNPAAAVDAALTELRSRSRAGSVSLIVLLTDGGIDTGSKTRDGEIQHLMEAQVLPEVRKQNIRIYPIAFTPDADRSLLEKMASGSGGECYLASTPDALESVLRRLATVMDKLTRPVTPQSSPEPTKPSGDLQQPVPPMTTVPATSSKMMLSIVLAGFIALLAGGYFFFLRPKLALQQRGPVPEASLVDLRTGKSFRIEKAVFRIGRKAENDLVIAERTVSGQHAKIRYQKGKFYLQDLRSANETKLNGQKVAGEVELRSGDVIRFDQFGYTFKGPDTDADRTLLRN